MNGNEPPETLHTKPLLNLAGVGIGFDTVDGFRQVVSDLDLAINSGEIVGLVGESGSGKSVTAKLVLGALATSRARISGSVTIFGSDLLGMKSRERGDIKRHIAYVPQDPMSALNPSFRIGAQMTDVMVWQWSNRSLLRYLIMRRRPSIRRKAEQVAVDLLGRVHISDPRSVLQKYPSQLSGGMRQRVLLALAMSGTPRLLVADEPTTALDVTVQKATIELIQELVEREGMGGLYITHDLGVARMLCARTYVMHRGRIVEAGETRALLDRPSHPYTRELVEAIPRLDARMPVRVFPSVPEPHLAIIDLSKSFGSLRAVESASFEIRKGETFAIVGESGSGKTTIAQMLVRIVKPTSGDIRVSGRSILASDGKNDGELRDVIQLVFQDPGSSLNPRRTVEQIIGAPLKRRGMKRSAARRARIAELLERVALSPALIHRRPTSLSGGQKQRVTIARALAMEPKILVLDEPTSALDVSVQRRILDLLKDLRERNDLTYVLITHDIGVVRAIADRVAVMRRGQIVEMGNVDDVLLAPQADYTRTLLAAVPSITEELNPLPA